MASEQDRREKSTGGEKVEVEKVRVPKMASHFESLAEKESPEKREQPSLEEISKQRGTAQQNSWAEIMAAEDRYAKAKQSEQSGGKEEMEKGSEEKGEMNKGSGLDSGYIAEMAKEKGQQAKETAYNVGKITMDYTMPVAEKAKEKVAPMSESAAHYVSEKATAAKDVTVESGKGAVGYAGKVAEDVKDKAVVVGWTAAQFSTEKAVEGTKAAARVVQGVAGYAGETVAEVGHKAVEYAAKPLGAAKEVAVTTGESAKEYTARKKEEAEKELEAKKLGQKGYGTEMGKGGESITSEQGKEGWEHEEGSWGSGEMGGDRSSVLGAIGETIAEIAQETKGLVIGHDQCGTEAGEAGQRK